jgi:hypothetical protein
MNMTPNDPRTEASTCKSSGTQPENSEAWIARVQALTAKGMTSKAHMQVYTNKDSREKKVGRKPGPNWVETDPGRLAQASRPSPFCARFGAPFDLAAILRTMCGSRTGGWSLPCVMSDWQRCVDWFLAKYCRCRLRLDSCWCRWRTSAKGRCRWGLQVWRR